MIKIKLPILNQEVKDGKFISEKSEINCFLDVSALSQEIWEREFPQQAQKEALFDYMDRVIKQPDNLTKAISIIKILYCFIHFEKPTTKDEWLRMFNLLDADYIKELIDTISNVFKLIYPEDRKNY